MLDAKYVATRKELVQVREQVRRYNAFVEMQRIRAEKEKAEFKALKDKGLLP